jgi:hypothetical protein
MLEVLLGGTWRLHICSSVNKRHWFGRTYHLESKTVITEEAKYLLTKPHGITSEDRLHLLLEAMYVAMK